MALLWLEVVLRHNQITPLFQDFQSNYETIGRLISMVIGVGHVAGPLSR